LSEARGEQGGIAGIDRRSGDRAARRFVEFFTVRIHSRSTRAAYAHKSGGSTALMLASSNGHREVVQALLDMGAEVNAADRGGTVNALSLASSNGHREVVKLLLDKGAKVNAAARIGASQEFAPRWCIYSTSAPLHHGCPGHQAVVEKALYSIISAIALGSIMFLFRSCERHLGL